MSNEYRKTIPKNRRGGAIERERSRRFSMIRVFRELDRAWNVREPFKTQSTIRFDAYDFFINPDALKWNQTRRFKADFQEPTQLSKILAMYRCWHSHLVYCRATNYEFQR